MTKEVKKLQVIEISPDNKQALKLIDQKIQKLNQEVSGLFQGKKAILNVIANEKGGEGKSYSLNQDYNLIEISELPEEEVEETEE